MIEYLTEAIGHSVRQFLGGFWIVVLVLLVLLFNLIPGLSDAAAATAKWFVPYMFVAHVSLLFVLLIDAAFYIVFKLLMTVFRR